MHYFRLKFRPWNPSETVKDTGVKLREKPFVVVNNLW